MPFDAQRVQVHERNDHLHDVYLNVRSIDRGNDMTKRIILLGLVAVLLAACSSGESDQPTTASETPASDETGEEEAGEGSEDEAGEEPEIADGELIVSATDRNFQGLTEAVAGPLEITFRNLSQFNHELVVSRLPKAPSLDAIARMKMGELTKLVTEVGKTRRITGNSETTLKLKLKPGKYGLLCLVEVGGGLTHTSYGMYRQLTVEARS